MQLRKQAGYIGTCMHEKGTTARDYRTDIDGLRAVAVTLVLGFHIFPTLLPGGFIGVDVFFVISGFLITGIITKGITQKNFSFLDFYARRARRIFPALTLILLASLTAGYFLLTPKQFEDLGREAAASAMFVPNLLFWSEAGYFDAAAATKPLLHLWSLGIEEQFYLVWPICLLAFHKRRSGFSLILPGLVFVSFGYSAYAAQHHSAAAFYLLPSRAWELGAGSLLSMMRLLPGPRLSNLAFLFGLAAIGRSAVTLHGGVQFPGANAVPVIIGSMLILGFGGSSTFAQTIIGNRYLQYIGRISYPLYLWHWPILVFAQLAKFKPLTGVEAILVLIASLAFAILTHEFVERPVREVSVHSLRPSALVATISLAVTAAIGVALVYSSGFPGRLPPAIQTALAYEHYDFTTDGRYPDCWLSADRTFREIGATCIQPGPNTVAIWGDSHAARLTAGLRLVFGPTQVSQYTRNGCPPILDVTTPECIAGNNAVLQSIRDGQQKLLIIFGAWENYSTDWSADSDLSKALVKTVTELKSHGVSNILLLGPTPRFEPTLPAIILRVCPERSCWIT